MTKQILPEQLWRLLRHNFETDDGSLPTIALQNLTSAEVGELYSAIRKGSQIESTNATFWDLVEETERALDDVPNAAWLVSTGRAAPFHFVIRNAGTSGTTIPSLGIHILQDLIAIDYRMGSEWAAPQVFEFFNWLEALLQKTKVGVLVPASADGPPDAKAFASAWASFRARDQQSSLD